MVRTLVTGCAGSIPALSPIKNPVWYTSNQTGQGRSPSSKTRKTPSTKPVYTIFLYLSSVTRHRRLSFISLATCQRAYLFSTSVASAAFQSFMCVTRPKSLAPAS